MHNGLRKVARPTRKKPGMQEFFILVLVYSYYNRNDHNSRNEFSIPQSVIAEYFHCSVVTVKRWCEKLRDLGYLQYAKRENAGKTIYYKDNEVKKSYVIPPYKRIRCGNPNDKTDIKFLNVYILDQQGLNKYLSEKVDLDILSNIEVYKANFNDFITFLSERNKLPDYITSLDIDDKDSIKAIQKTLSVADKNKVKRMLSVKKKIEENSEYLAKKKKLDEAFPEFKCKYLEEGCLRLTHEICNTVNPLHSEKINENNYWRSGNARNNMLKELLNADEFLEYDINGSIYRLTYNLCHDNALDFNTDIYEIIWNNCGFNISWPKEQKELYRKSFKKLLMPIYMKEYSLGYRANQWEYIKKYYSEHPRKYKRLSKAEQEFFESYKLFADLTQKNMKDILDDIAVSMHNTLNIKKFLGSDIFTYESNLHIVIREKLMNIGIKCVNIYDGFYFIEDQISIDDFYKIYIDSMNELKDNLPSAII